MLQNKENYVNKMNDRYELDELTEQLREAVNGIYFEIHGLKAGIETDVNNSIPTWQAWCGDKEKYYDDLEAVMTDKFYEGYSLTELVYMENISIQAY